jgi:5-methylthioribose kinase
VTLRDGSHACAKRALAKLKVATDWQAPLERNHYEVAWLRRAGAIVPANVPRVLAEDREHGIALLQFLRPEDHRLWKSELLAGRADPDLAIAVATTIGRIHAATFRQSTDAAAFPTDALFDALRLDPYLRHTADRHPDLRARILTVLDATAAAKLALVHGDVSPKNILVNIHSGQPVLLDAECAWYGDPAFDAAFCLNHLVLKAIHLPALRHLLLEQAARFFTEWLSHLPVDHHATLEARTAALLPCLMLARVDGKSPVEYLSEQSRALVRETSIPLIETPRSSLASVIAAVHLA